MMDVVGRHFGYLIKELKKDIKTGAWWWFKNRHQHQIMELAILELNQQLDSEHFDFSMVFQLFARFNVRQETNVQAEWYLQAHQKLVKLHQELFKKDILTADLFRPVLTELKFIVEADQFHREWSLQLLQQRVMMMYQQLLDQVEQLKQSKNEQINLENKKLLVEQKKIELETIQTQKQAIALQKEKAQILKEKVIEEKLLRETKKQESIELQKKLELENERDIRVAAEIRKMQLEKSMQDIAGQWEQQLGKNSDISES